MKNGIKLATLCGILILASLGCSFFGSETEPTLVPEKPTLQAAPTKAQVAPTKEQVAPTKEQVAPTQEPTRAEPSQTPVSVLDEPWRLTPYKTAALLVSDRSAKVSPDWMEILNKQAANLAIPRGFSFEVYTVPGSVTYPNLRDHYNRQLTEKGMKKAQDYVGSNKVALATWIHGTKKTRKVAMQFNPAKGSDSRGVYFLIYSNPGE